MKREFLNLVTVVALTSTTVLMAGFANTDKLLASAKKEAGEMEPKALKVLIDKEEPVIVLDVRESEQRSEGEIYADESYAITRGNLEFVIGNKVKDKNALIVTYCRSGGRGALAAQQLRHLGYKNATNLKGGLKAWARSGYPVETGLGTVIITKEPEEE
ncbi:sulfurtransferase [Sulfurimonas sp. SAG-AH-194-L11]|nr:rhodanese-like domain-containing protein [Sulfurimonas sp. SAG-AH-194-L11]MDF1876652.1 sulfurtransferase [Sulfurimonas sp. SAG-AH-194-L11]